MSNYTELFTERLRRINTLLQMTTFEYGNPVAFMNASNSKTEHDHNTKLLGDKRYQRYTFKHGAKVLLTIQSNGWYFKPGNPLFSCSVVSLLIEIDGEVVNPFIQDMTESRALIEEATMTKDCLDMLIGHLDGSQK